MAVDFGDDYVHSRAQPFDSGKPKTTDDDEVFVIICLCTGVGIAVGLLIGWFVF